jgi:hypothetical protein
MARVLKCHLIVEHYLNQFLSSHLELTDFDDVRLTFAQKAKLLPDRASAAAFVKPAIIQLNRLRNRFAHTLGAEVSFDDLGAMQSILEVARRGVTFNSPVAAIEEFTTVACTFLIVTPPDLQRVFAEAFADVRIPADLV